MPPPGWRPLSGWALTGLILGVLLSGTALVTGLWWLAAFGVLLCIVGMVTGAPPHHRGRGLALTGLVLCVLGGSFALWTQRALFALTEELGRGVLRPLSATSLPDAERLSGLEAWLGEAARADGAAARILTRHDQLRELVGGWQGSASAGGLFSSHLPVFLGPPASENLVRSDDPTKGPPGLSASSTVGKLLWLRGDFERGPVWIALHLEAKIEEAMLTTTSRESAPVLSDVVFYVKPAAER